MSFVDDFKIAWNISEIRRLWILGAIALFFIIVNFIWDILKVFGVINTPPLIKSIPSIGEFAALLAILGFVIGTSIGVGKILTEFKYVKKDVRTHTKELSRVNLRLSNLESDMSFVKNNLSAFEQRFGTIEKKVGTIEQRVEAIAAKIGA